MPRLDFRWGPSHIHTQCQECQIGSAMLATGSYQALAESAAQSVSYLD